TGSIGMMAYVFSDYAVKLWDLGDEWKIWLAAAPVVALSLLNLLGVVFGKRTQNVLSVAKVLGLAGVVVSGFLWAVPRASGDAGSSGGETNFRFAMVLILVTYGGWNDSAYVAAEVRDGSRNIPRALLLGITGITVLYLLVNGAYLWGLGFEGVKGSKAV